MKIPINPSPGLLRKLWHPEIHFLSFILWTFKSFKAPLSALCRVDRFGLKLLVSGVLLLQFAGQGNAQQDAMFTKYMFNSLVHGGVNSGAGDFADHIESGINYGLSLDYMISPTFGIGIDGNIQSNDHKRPSMLDLIPTSTMYDITSDLMPEWRAMSFEIGPVVRLGGGSIAAELYSKAGITNIESAGAEYLFNYQGAQRDIYTLSWQKVSGFSLTSGLRLKFNISDQFSFFLNPQYVYTDTEVGYNFRDPAGAYRPDPAGLEVFDPAFMIEQPLVSEVINPSYFNLNVGMSLAFGGGKSKNVNAKTPLSEKATNDIVRWDREESISNEVEDQTENSDCVPVKLEGPNDNESYNLADSNRPDYEWIDHTDKAIYYEFQLFINGQEVYKTKTKKKGIKHNNELERVYQSAVSEEGTEFSWNVISNFKDCVSIQSRKRTWYLNSCQGGYHCLEDIKCLGTNSDGSANYSGVINFTNTSGQPMYIVSLIFDSQVINYSLSDCINGSPITLPITVNPLSTSQVCVEFTVLPGTQTIKSTAEAKGYPKSVQKNRLPKCICKTCDDWLFAFKGGQINHTPNGSANYMIEQDMRIFGADPIIRMKAEVVYMRHTLSNDLCRTCTNNDDHMALFESGAFLQGQQGPSPNPNAYLSDYNNDDYANQLIWKNTGGVDFSQAKLFVMKLNLPEHNELGCCGEKYKICIRYTYTDINCNTCDVLRCYNIKH